ncbi:cyanobactin maturation protease, PatA/PatG family [Clostridium cavendishii DSM 21758]|uniref:Cyanobactin maturation protease, PatA/PatG family n=1 Tax=Clostridium cavendishii DSM 21758 TaxID=1121302 RepID=A0A1M6HIA8_9CLOT|nr:PatA/PatG family cyanobactin maturation protease [Clostridium cavendishii]SHJ21941.1 cyanobactin maturation protease, PatA/PatG family [Clostridium cavendishii DSM 21758]
MDSIYLDNNATTHVDPEVTTELLPLLNDNYGNPSSSHEFGKNAKKALETARGRVASLINCDSKNIIFTSGGTESNNLAINGLAQKLTQKHHFITSQIEHSSVLEVFHQLEEKGHKVTYLSVDKNGLIYPNQVEEAIKTNENTALISLMLVNNETGVIFPIKEIGKIAKKYNILFHCDAVQAIGKIPINVNELNVDSISISGHKLHAPKGAGALYIADINTICPLILGGNQENGKRSGTEPLPAIVGLGKACEIISKKMDIFVPVIRKNRDLLEQKILKIMPTTIINSYKAPRVCNTSSIQFPGIVGKKLIEQLSNNKIYVSHGSACANNHIGNSHVLKAMGLTDSEICSSLRFSVSKENTEEDINEVINRLSIIFKNIPSEKNNYYIGTSENLSLSKTQYNNDSYEDFYKQLKLLQSKTMGDPNICIAILDGPVDLSHSCFNGANLKNMDVENINYSVKGEATEHGTHITSIIFGQQSGGINGIAPNCRGIILPIYSDDSNGNIIKCNQLGLATAITKAVELGAHIINISGGELVSDVEPENYLRNAINLCKEKGVLIVAAAGNDGCKCLNMPACIPSVLSVGSMDEYGSPSEYSNWGDPYQFNGILAPGENILGAIPNNKSKSKSGTSFSTAIVTGCIALLLSNQIKNGTSPDPLIIRDALLSTASSCKIGDASEANRCLAGKINISETLKQILEKETSTEEVNSYNNINSNINILEMKGSRKFMTHEDNNQNSNPISENSSNDTNITKKTAPVEVSPSECNACKNSTQSQFVYVLGNIGYDFPNEARRDSFTQAMASVIKEPNPYNPKHMIQFLKQHPFYASSLIWTISQESSPLYAIHPSVHFNSEVYDLLREFLEDSTAVFEGIICSIPGVLSGNNVTLINGYTVPILIPELRGMCNWSIDALVKTISAQLDSESQKYLYSFEDDVKKFLKRVYYQLRNLGITSGDRALNYTGTNLVQVKEIFNNPDIVGQYALDTIEVERSSICRPNSDCWDVKIILFKPKKLLEEARKVFLFTVDVSDIVPVSIGTIRDWEMYSCHNN